MSKLTQLGKMLLGNSEQLLSSKDYRVAHQMRIRAGQAMAVFTPLVAVGAVINSPVLMIPALYIPTALVIPRINYLFMKLAKKGNFFLHAAEFAGVFIAIAIYEKVSGAGETMAYAREHGMHMLYHQLHYQAQNGWALVIGGLAMTGICAWLAYTLMKGKRTQSMQRIALHLSEQESING